MFKQGRIHLARPRAGTSGGTPLLAIPYLKTVSLSMIPARWLCGLFVMGLLFAATTSEKCPYKSGQTHQTAGYVPKPLYPGAANIKSDCYSNPDHGYKPPSSKEYHTVPHSYCPKVGGLESHCRLAKDCAVWYDLVRKTPGTACTLKNGYDRGLCCPGLPLNTYSRAPFQEASPCDGIKLDDHVHRWDLDSVNAAAHHAGQHHMGLVRETESGLARKNIFVRPGTDRHTHSSIFFQTADEALKVDGNTLHGVLAGHHLVHGHQVKPDQVHCALNRFEIKDTIVTNTCPAFPICDKKALASPYRTITGLCNHVHYPGSIPWGVANSQYQRLLAPDYADGYWMPRRTVDGSELPPPRVVSLTVVRDVEVLSETDTIFVMQFGQVIDHDLLETLESKLADGSAVPCCTEDGQFLSEEDYAHGKCIPIVIPKDDPFYSRFHVRCMQFARSAPACRNDGRFGYVEQNNINTHFLDLSAVYGSDDQVAFDLRTFQKGSLKATPGPRNAYYQDKDLMPGDNETTANCALSKAVTGIDPPPEVKCFKAGDNRVNCSPYMMAAQTAFFRQHNLIAEALAGLNPHWGDERIYQEARRIVIAQYAHIVYNEYLPAVIGRRKMEEVGIFPLQNGFSSDYDKSVNPSILNEFAAVAFRFGHSLVQGRQSLVNEQREIERTILLRQQFFKTQEMYVPGNADKFTIAMATLAGEKVDNYFTVELTNHLFEEEGKGFGMDLVSLDTQRGRDHGIKGYNHYRTLCGRPHAKDFDDLLDVLPAKVVEDFKLLYNSVDDIDLIIAGVSEKLVEGAAVGPTFQCIMAEQFLRLKRGDRYFYDLGGQPGSFTEEQLNEIRKISYSRIVCDNSDIHYMQPLVFKLISDLNPLVNCESTDSIPRTSLLPWKEVTGSAY